MPELKGVDTSGFDGSVDPNAIPYKDKSREKERLRKLSEPRVPRPKKERQFINKDNKRPVKKIKKPQKKRKFQASLACWHGNQASKIKFLKNGECMFMVNHTHCS